MKFLRPIAIALLISLLTTPSVQAAENDTKDPFSIESGSRILVVAPHPDDETLGAGGLMSAALSKGAEVRVLYLTHGESNEISALFYQKKPLILKSDFIRSGQIRKEEAIEALSVIGLSAMQLVFLGYPDLGMLALWERCWENAKPYRSLFSRVNKVIHQDDFSYGKYYTGENVLGDFEKVLSDYRPTHVFVTAPFDKNNDHQAAYLFLRVALMNLSGKIESPKVFVYLIHALHWPKPRGYDPSKTLAPPSPDRFADIQWVSYPISRAELQKKENSLNRYHSQMSYAKKFLRSFLRNNELFAEYPSKTIVVDTFLDRSALNQKAAPLKGSVRYSANPNEIFVEIPFRSSLDQMGAIRAYVFGYNDNVPFSQMPKLNMRLFGQKLQVKNGSRRFTGEGVSYKIEKDRLILQISRKVLKDPSALFVSTRTSQDAPSLDFGSWRVIEIK